MRSGLGASATLARTATLIGLSFGLLSVPVSHLPSERQEIRNCLFFLIVLPYSSEASHSLPAGDI